jgi:hypothetical protein
MFLIEKTLEFWCVNNLIDFAQNAIIQNSGLVSSYINVIKKRIKRKEQTQTKYNTDIFCFTDIDQQKIQLSR